MDAVKLVDVCLTPELMHQYPVADRSVVVVDIFRATSCMVTALASGVASIMPFAKLEDCLAMKAKGYDTAGERDGKKVEGFDHGNSPFEYMVDEMKGRRLAFTTTNGTQAIARSLGAREIVIGAFLNLSAVAAHLKNSGNNVLIVCSGWKGKFNLEDTLFAGALVDLLEGDYQPECDAPLAARCLYLSARNDMKAFLANASHVKRLAKLNVTRDIEFCLTADVYKVVPVLDEGVLLAR
jgi:2-phosphosulfolactate phosphatase